jgi:hypothetical protein
VHGRFSLTCTLSCSSFSTLHWNTFYHESGSNTAFGTIKFATEQDAIEALVLANHCKVHSAGMTVHLPLTPILLTSCLPLTFPLPRSVQIRRLRACSNYAFTTKLRRATLFQRNNHSRPTETQPPVVRRPTVTVAPINCNTRQFAKWIGENVPSS